MLKLRHGRGLDGNEAGSVTGVAEATARRGGSLLARVCNALPTDSESLTRSVGEAPGAVRRRAAGSNPVGSASQTRASGGSVKANPKPL